MKVLIVDDEPLAREELHYLIQGNSEVTEILEADGIFMAEEQVKSEHPDMVFLDRKLSDGNGMALAEKIKSFDNSPHIVFATAYDSYALDAFEADAVDYILKPFSAKRVNEAIMRVAKLISPEDDATKAKKYFTYMHSKALFISGLLISIKSLVDRRSLIFMTN